MVERAALEMRYTYCTYRGFESLTLRRVSEKDVHKRVSFRIYLDMKAFSTPDMRVLFHLYTACVVGAAITFDEQLTIYDTLDDELISGSSLNSLGVILIALI